MNIIQLYLADLKSSGRVKYFEILRLWITELRSSMFRQYSVNVCWRSVNNVVYGNTLEVGVLGVSWYVMLPTEMETQWCAQTWTRASLVWELIYELAWYIAIIYHVET